MKLFRYRPDVNRFACIEMAGDFLSEVLPIVEKFDNGTSLADKWKPVEIVFDMSMGDISDFPGLQEAVPVFSRRAWEILGPLISNDVEALPLICPQGEYFAINVLSIVDCLDQERSTLKRRPDGSISRVSSYAFKPNCLHGKHMMKLQETLETFISEDFLQLANANRLSGAVFRPIVDEASSLRETDSDE